MSDWAKVAKDVLLFGGLLFTAGYSWARFEQVESDVVLLEQGEELMATRAEVEAVADRLRRWIDRSGETSSEVHDALHSLELYVAATHGEIP